MSSSAHEVRIELAPAYWRDAGFVEMVPPIVPATSPGAREKIVVWIRLPERERWTAQWSERTRRFVPTYATGTVADRVDLSLDDGAWRVADVRGTTFVGDGERFHVLRPDPTHPASLVGMEWRCDDPVGERIATRELVSLACREPGTDVAFFRRRNACADCHEHDKPAAQIDPDDDRPFAATDGGGLYQILKVLRDQTPVDDARGCNVSLGSPYVRVSCRDGEASIVRGEGELRARCGVPGEVPSATFDMPKALRDHDPHARAVCASRRYLFEHASGAAKRAFHAEFGECGLE